MNEVYANLIRLVDVHIDHLIDLEDALDAELQATEASMLPVPSYHEPLLFDEETDSSDDEAVVYSPITQEDDNAIMSLSQLGLGHNHHVTFSETVFEIGTPTPLSDSSTASGRTVPLQYTPFDHRLLSRIHSSDSDDDSDTDTVVVEWIDPATSPVARYMNFDEEDDYAIL